MSVAVFQCDACSSKLAYVDHEAASLQKLVAQVQAAHNNPPPRPQPPKGVKVKLLPPKSCPGRYKQITVAAPVPEVLPAPKEQAKEAEPITKPDSPAAKKAAKA